LYAHLFAAAGVVVNVIIIIPVDIKVVVIVCLQLQLILVHPATLTLQFFGPTPWDVGDWLARRVAAKCFVHDPSGASGRTPEWQEPLVPGVPPPQG
jgi:hypothetical protein